MKVWIYKPNLMLIEKLPEDQKTQKKDSQTAPNFFPSKKVRAREIAQKLKSIEHFIFVWGEKARYYLPPRKLISWHYVSQILASEKKLLQAERVGMPITLPKIKGHRIQALWCHLKSNPEFSTYFPDLTEKRQIPRDYFLNVLLEGAEGRASDRVRWAFEKNE